MSDAEELWAKAFSAKEAREIDKREQCSKDYLAATTHYNWLRLKVLEPAAERGNYCITGYDLPPHIDQTAFEAVLKERGYNAIAWRRGRVYRIDWAKSKQE